MDVVSVIDSEVRRPIGGIFAPSGGYGVPQRCSYRCSGNKSNHDGPDMIGITTREFVPRQMHRGTLHSCRRHENKNHSTSVL